MTRYHWQVLKAGPLKLDGGSMFGVVPRAVWSRSMPPDDLGRIDLGHNCLLLSPVVATPVSPGRQGDAGVATTGSGLIEVGSGDKFDEKNRNIFGLTGEWIGTALAKVNVAPESIRNVRQQVVELCLSISQIQLACCHARGRIDMPDAAAQHPERA